MELSGDSELKKKCTNSREVSNKAVRSGRIKKSSQGSSRHKNFDNTQSSILRAWLTKELSEKPLRDMKKSCNKTDSVNGGEEEEKSFSPGSNITPKKKQTVKKYRKKRKKPHRDRSTGTIHYKEEIVDNDKKSCKRNKSEINRTSALQVKSDAIDVEETAKEKMARNKIKQIMTKPLSFTSVEEKLNINFQIHILSSESSEHSSGSSVSGNNTNKKYENNSNNTPKRMTTGSPKRILKKTSEIKSNTKQAGQGDVIVTPTKQKPSPVNLRQSPRSIKSPKSTAIVSNIKNLFNDTSELKCNEDSLRSSKSIKVITSPKNINKRTKQAERGDVVITPTKQKKSRGNLRQSPRNIKSLTASVAKNLFQTQNTTKNGTGTSELSYNEGSLRSNKFIKVTTSPKHIKNKIIECYKKTNSCFSEINNKIKQTAQDDVDVTPSKKKSPVNVRRSPRSVGSPKSTAAISVAKKLFDTQGTLKNESNTSELKYNEDSLRSSESIKVTASPKHTKNKITRRAKTNNSTSEINDRTKQAEQSNVAVTPTKQKKNPVNLRLSPRSVKSPKSTLNSASAKEIVTSGQNSGLSTTDKGSIKKSGGNRTKIRNKKGDLKSRKSERVTASPECRSHKITEYCEKTNMSISANNNRTKDAEQYCVPTEKSVEAPRTSPKSTSTSKQLSSSFVQCNNKKPTWLTKDISRIREVKQTARSSKRSNQSGETVAKRAHKTSKKYKTLDVKVNSNDSERFDNEAMTKEKKSRKKTVEGNLDDYLSKSSKGCNKRKFCRSESYESNEFPSFVNKNKKLKRSVPSESFRKYGVTLPSVEEILKEQEDLAAYKNQIESFKDIDEKIFELPFFVKDLKDTQVANENILGCKHLSIHDIEEAFCENLDYVSDIFHGKRYSERHEIFFEANVRNYELTVNDLRYNTSTIVFSFEQKEHLLALLKKEFDSEDKWTLYFFQVLLPELCLKIFMDTHAMAYDEAVKYLDTRPIVED